MTASPPDAPEVKLRSDLFLLLADAIHAKNIEVVKLALAKGAPTDLLVRHDQWNGIHNYIRPLMHFACEVYHEDIFKALAVAGADINSPDLDKGYTVIMRAAKSGSTHIVKVCIDLGADVAHVAKDGETLFSMIRKRSIDDSSRKQITEIILQAMPDAKRAFEKSADRNIEAGLKTSAPIKLLRPINPQPQGGGERRKSLKLD